MRSVPAGSAFSAALMRSPNDSKLKESSYSVETLSSTTVPVESRSFIVSEESAIFSQKQKWIWISTGL